MKEETESEAGVALANSIWKVIMQAGELDDGLTAINFDDTTYALAKVLGDVASLGDAQDGSSDRFMKLAVVSFLETYAWRVEQATFPRDIMASENKENAVGTIQ